GPDDVEVVLAPMRRRHLRSVLRIEAQVYPRPWSLSLFMSELALRTSRVYLVARVDGFVTGYAGMMLAGDDAHVTTIAVEPEWHRYKIGTRLLLHLIREAIARDARHVTLEVRVGNQGAQALYRLFGFRPAGVRKNYYAETNEDALVMWADDVDQPEYKRRLARIEKAVLGSTTVEQS
ncbi:MAG: ribosomal protein S18-alanine N-acetyltransferase, partial [Actinobacteria bacterium]|nr:ribosomal protein S18-alanine N-acetyltransferase [Actinomycetota bacterium]